MFPVAATPIIIIYNTVCDIQVPGSASAFCQGPQSHMRAVYFSRASVPSWPRRETTRQRGAVVVMVVHGMVGWGCPVQAGMIHLEFVESNPCTWI